MTRSALTSFIRQEFRYHYRKPIYLFIQMVSTLIALLVFSLTSDALGNVTVFSAKWMASSYFEFLLLGHLIVLFPVTLCEVVARAARFSANEGLLEAFFLLRDGPVKPLISLSLAMLVREFFYFAMMSILAVAVFGYRLSLAKAAMIAALITVSLPLFLGIGLLGAAVFLTFGRGEGLFSQLGYVATVFAGVFFPLSALPAWINEPLKNFTPFAALVDISRRISSGLPVNFSLALICFFAASVLIFAFGYLILKRAVENLRRRPWPVFSHP